MASRVGVFGGTFDPVHSGHLDVARAVRAAHRLDRVLLVPARVRPQKGAGDAPADQRLAMVRLACEAEDGLEADDVELRRDGPSFTADTLDELARRHPGDELFFILGADAMLELPQWRDPERIVARARLVVVNRPGFELDWDAPRFHIFSPAAMLRIQSDVVTMPPSPVTSTALRRDIRAGVDVSDRVPAAVVRHIAENGLYGAD